MNKILLCFLLASCSTLDQSMKLGSGLGAMTGASTVLISSNGPSNAKAEDVLMASGIGAIIGGAISFLIHRQIDKERSDFIQSTEVQFGDLPPNPFQFSNSNNKGGK